jgi:hypothetical protein
MEEKSPVAKLVSSSVAFSAAWSHVEPRDIYVRERSR